MPVVSGNLWMRRVKRSVSSFINVLWSSPGSKGSTVFFQGQGDFYSVLSSNNRFNAVSLPRGWEAQL